MFCIPVFNMGDFTVNAAADNVLSAAFCIEMCIRDSRWSDDHEQNYLQTYSLSLCRYFMVRAVTFYLTFVRICYQGTSLSLIHI